MFAEALYCLSAIHGLCNNHEIRLAADDVPDAGPNDGVIVND
jgi:hypothetical protein